MEAISGAEMVIRGNAYNRGQVAAIVHGRDRLLPFVIPTVLASFWSLLMHPDSWGDAVAEAIGLGGDVDTLGAIVGALMGARLGIDAVPSHLAASVVDSRRLRRLADRYFAVVHARRR